TLAWCSGRSRSTGSIYYNPPERTLFRSVPLARLRRRARLGARQGLVLALARSLATIGSADEAAPVSARVSPARTCTDTAPVSLPLQRTDRRRGTRCSS